jgi:hypothetical protein
LRMLQTILFIMSFDGLDDLVGAIVAGELSYNWTTVAWKRAGDLVLKFKQGAFFKGGFGHELPENVPLLGFIVGLF